MQRFLAINHFPIRNFHLTVRYENMQRRPVVGVHSHDFTELVVITGGHGRHLLRHSSYPIAAGDVFLITEGMVHGYAEADKLTLINILFHPERLHLARAELRKMPGYHALFMLEPHYREKHNFKSHLHLPIQELTNAIVLADAMRQEINQRKAGFEFMATALFMQLLGYLARYYECSQTPNTRALIRISKGISFLEQHYMEPIKLAELREITHQSTSALIAHFKTATGMSPIEYLIHLRIQRACEILRSKDLNITEAAFQVGFSDSNYFSRQFHRIMGLSPRSFIHRNR
ncbi:MAG: AraC family transcriptional regulator [Kiritimatiellae bacterium]|nr:AraC family transcriptional regulator [Kiritimatiellia bacterium]